MSEGMSPGASDGINSGKNDGVSPGTSSRARTGAGIDVVIVSYECREALRRCLRSLHETGDDLRTVVVDNASTDGSAAMVQAEFPSVHLIGLDRNIGFGAAVNRAAAVGTSELLLLLNPDTEVTAEAIATLRDAIGRDPGIGGVGPRIRDEAGELELSRGRTMSPANEAWFKILEAVRGLRPVRGWLERSYGRAAETSSLTAACLLVRRESFEAVRGFDERFFLYGEDVDLCRRMARAGWRLRFEPSAQVRHMRGVSARVRPEATEIAYRRSQLAFYRKHHPGWVAALLGVYLRTRYRWAEMAGDPEEAARARRVRRAIDRLEGLER